MGSCSSSYNKSSNRINNTDVMDPTMETSNKAYISTNIQNNDIKIDNYTNDNYNDSDNSPNRNISSNTIDISKHEDSKSTSENINPPSQIRIKRRPIVFTFTCEYKYNGRFVCPYIISGNRLRCKYH